MLIFRILCKCWHRVIDTLLADLTPRIKEKLFCGLHALLLFYRRYKPQEIRPKTLLLIRLDRMGDYCLFRNFLKPLRESYPDYEITLGCSKYNRELVDLCGDTNFIDRIIVIDNNKWNFWSLLKTLFFFSRQSYEIVVYAMYRRVYFYDLLVYIIHAKHKIRSQYFEPNSKRYLTSSSLTLQSKDSIYTTILDASPATLFEFDRNKEFFSQLLKKPLTDIKYHLDLPPSPKDFPLPCKPYGVFFLGASVPRKKWSLQSWIELALKISPDFQIVLCGSKSEINEAQEIMLGFPKALNLVGQTTFIELLHVLSSSSFIISVETAIPYFAVALGLGPIFVICNGSALGRFLPYPEYIQANYHVIYHPKVEALLATPHGFGRCMEIYTNNKLDLRIYCPGFITKVVEKMKAVDERLVR